MKKRQSSLGVGASTILMIFVVLCMSILSILTYMSAKENDAESKRELEYVQAYYEADQIANTIIEQMKQQPLEEVMAQYAVKYEQKDDVVAFQVPIKEKRVLYVEVNDAMEIKAWHTMSGGETNDFS